FTFFFFSSRRRHTRSDRDWSSDVCSSDLLGRRLGRTVLLTNRLDWTAEQVVAGYAGQQQVERVFRGLKDGEWLGWGPMHHWTDKIGRASCRERVESSVVGVIVRERKPQRE